VVTEFPRSKKLIKYPREAIPGNNSAVGSAYTYSASDGDYVIKVSSEYDTRFRASNAFDSNMTTFAWLSGPGGTRYISGSPETTGSVSSSTFAKFGAYGEWLELKIPTSIYLNYVVVYPKDARTTSKITSAIVWGSNTGNDGAWQRLSTISGVADYTESNPLKISVDSHVSYNYYALQITSINPIPTQYAVVSELELYGTPEYDPEAHGVDVVVKSVPNVPNTDWLEVYYDAKNYTSGVVQDLSTNSFNGTLTNGASYNNSDGISKFAFDAGTNQYMTTTTTQTGEYIHTTSMWMKFSELTSSQHYLFTMGGTSGGFSRIGMYYSANNGIRVTSGVDYRSRFHPTPGEWFHVTYTYSGGTLNQGASDVNVKFYINGSRWMFQDYYQGGGTTPTALNLPGTNTLQINGQNGANNIYIDTEVGNFRLFNRVLTTDEIYQLYAYQKEYFGHGVLGMTLKNGRLGIGTSEPRAALDVQGIPHGPNSRPCWTLRATSVNSDNFAVWDQSDIDNFNGATGDTGYIIPVSGYYFMQAIVIVSASGGRGTLRFYKNGTGIGANFLQDPVTTAINTNRPWNQLTGIITYYFKQGDMVKVSVGGSTYSSYNCFTGFHLGF
jgi:hypothetical protein